MPSIQFQKDNVMVTALPYEIVTCEDALSIKPGFEKHHIINYDES